MAENIQAIYIREHDIRQHPKPHIVYRIEVHAAVRNWNVWKRYSEFVTLHSRLLSIYPKQPPPVPLPGKRYFPSTFSNPEKVLERQRGLETYLRGILSSRDDRWRETELWKEFLSIPTGRALDASVIYTSDSWLDEYNSMANSAREVRSLINRRSAHIASNEISASHNCTVQAKKLLMTLSARLSNLEAGLMGLANGRANEPNIISEGELRRRRDMLDTLKDEKDTLLKLVNSGRSEQDLLKNNVVKENKTVERKALLGEDTRPVRKGRAFGAAALKRQQQLQQQETQETRGVDNQGLLGYQQQVMQDQDQQVEQFSALLARQKQLGIAIGDELETQNQLLDELDNDVGRTHTKLKFAKKKLGTIK